MKVQNSVLLLEFQNYFVFTSVLPSGYQNNLVFTACYSQVIRMMSWDEARSVDLKLKLLAEDEWNLHKLNMKYYKNECTEEQNNPRYGQEHFDSCYGSLLLSTTECNVRKTHLNISGHSNSYLVCQEIFSFNALLLDAFKDVSGI